MKKIYLLSAFLMLSSAAHSFPGTIDFTQSKAGVEHAITLKNWHVDKRGVPSFDYFYSQKKAACEYKVEGHAIAGFVENGKKAELEVLNMENQKTHKEEQVLVLYDNDNAVNFALPLEDAQQKHSVNFYADLTKNARKKDCANKTDEINIFFKKK